MVASRLSRYRTTGSRVEALGASGVRVTLRAQVVRGSAFLVIRQGVGVVIGVGGILLLTRLIGPAAYGTFAAAQVVLSYAVAVTELGLGVYLIRMAQSEEETAFHQAFTLLLILGVGGALIGMALLPLLKALVPLPGFGPAVVALLAGLPMVHLAKVPIARLEHRLDYRRVAIIEIAGIFAYYGVALGLAFRGWKVGAPIAGWWAQFGLHLLMAFRTGYRPRLMWNVPLIRKMLRYGTAYSVSLWVQQLRSFINPVIVGRFVGATGVGYVALAIRIVEQLGFVRTATARISIAALARLQGERERIERAVTEGMTLQILSVGPLFIAFGLVAPWAIPRAFGPAWLPVLQIYPFVAVGYLFGAMFLLHTSTLIVLERNAAATAFYAAQITALGGVAWFLVLSNGVVGYAWAEVATVPVYLYLHVLVRRYAASPDYLIPSLWLVAFTLPLLSFGYMRYTFVFAFAPLLVPAARHQLLDVARVVLRRRPPADEQLPDGALVAADGQDEALRA